jgi:Raf kinase inhibitor-like YbhB/YbcL family protein
MHRTTIAAVLVLSLVLAGCGGETSGSNVYTPSDTAPISDSGGTGSGTSPATTLTVTTTSAIGGVLARRCTYGGGNRSLQLSIANLPSGTRSLAVVMDDPDALPMAGEVWAHWLVVDLPTTATTLAEGTPPPTPARQGQTSGGMRGYEGPDPPAGNHTYVIAVYALSTPTLSIDLGRTWTRAQFQSAFAGSILASGQVSVRAGTSSRGAGG